MTTENSAATEAKTTAKVSARPNRAVKVRQPLGTRAKLTFKDLEEGYNYRVLNDKDDRLQAAIEGGYEFVHSKETLGDTTSAEASSMDSRVSKPVGNGVTGYLMRIRSDFFEEDQALKEKSIKQTEAAMKPNTDKDQYGDGLENK